MFILMLLVYLQQTDAQLEIGKSCILLSNGFSGTCKLLTDCQRAKDDLLTVGKLPQPCGFQGTQPIVCCSNILKPGDLSRQKCKEYAANGKIECDGPRRIKRIVGGVRAREKEFPHMGMLGFEVNPSEIKWLCGASLISELYVVTAAHCTNNREYGPPKYVRMGITNFNKTENSQQIQLANIIRHPEYKNGLYYYDIALMKLEHPVEINAYVHPACLFTAYDFPDEKATATGWGTTDLAGTLSDNLVKVDLYFTDEEFCNSTYKNRTRRLDKGILYDRMFCTNAKSDIKDTCAGDNGGPFQIRHEVDCMYDIIGIISFGFTYCFGKPSVSTRISYYIEWIEKIVWINE